MPNLYTLALIIILATCAAIAVLWLALELAVGYWYRISRWMRDRWEEWRERRGYEELRRLARKRRA